MSLICSALKQLGRAQCNPGTATGQVKLPVNGREEKSSNFLRTFVRTITKQKWNLHRTARKTTGTPTYMPEKLPLPPPRYRLNYNHHKFRSIANKTILHDNATAHKAVKLLQKYMLICRNYVLFSTEPRPRGGSTTQACFQRRLGQMERLGVIFHCTPFGDLVTCCTWQTVANRA